MERLNGWQRLWVVVAALLLIGITLGGMDSYPSQIKIKQSYQKRFEFWGGCMDYYKGIEVGTAPSPSTCTGLKKESVERSYRQTAMNYGDEVERLPLDRLTWAARILGIWAGVNLAIFVVFSAVRWIYRGFRPKVV